MVYLTGKIEKKGFGFGVWALITEDGSVYELLDPPAPLCQAQSGVTIEGEIQEEVMTLAMIGPVLKVVSFEVGILDS
ncbi:hypothetical protein [Synechocystis sp. LKSZ1]|uniref:hypothetical protein n=1 Tax=Synechocystis sp. LKSZ1 TaxID=3144951 RepID=UPI00336C3071